MFQQRIERSIPPAEQSEGFPFETSWRPVDVVGGNWVWPLPFDLKPTNQNVWHLGDDGYPLGDLNWFEPEVLAAWEAGEPNPLPGVGVRKMETGDLSLVNYPNPFSSTTMIRYNLPSSSHVSMKIYDMAGAKVATLVNETQIAGQHEMMFDGTYLSGGVYFFKVQAGSLFQVQKMTLIK